MDLGALRERLRSSLWFLPALSLLATAVLAGITIPIDAALHERVHVGFIGGPDSARALLSTVAASMITFTGLVFSITIVVLQLASAQFSPRVLRTFLRDRTTQVALGVFVATFAYALTVLLAVRSGTDPFVPRLSVAISVALVVVSLVAFVYYIHHAAQSVRASAIVGAVGAETREVIDRMYPLGADGADRVTAPSLEGAEIVVRATHPAVLVSVDTRRLVGHAVDADGVVEIVPAVGDFVPEGAPLLRFRGAIDRFDAARASGALAFGSERTMRQDVAFGFRQLVDVAERALSPGVNDPTTAVQAIDQIHDLLRRLSRRTLRRGAFAGPDGEARLVVQETDWDDFVALAVDEVRIYAERSVQVIRRLNAMLTDLLDVVPPDRRSPLEREFRLLARASERTFLDVEDRESAEEADAQGMGSTD